MTVQLTELGLRNFKAFGNERQNAPMSNITLIYGPNSGGKSSIIHALLLMKQSNRDNHRVGDLAPLGEFVDLGAFTTMVHKHETHRDLEIDVHMRGIHPTGDADEICADVMIEATFNGDSTHVNPALTKVRYKLRDQEWESLEIGFYKQNTQHQACADREQETNSHIDFQWDESVCSINEFIQRSCDIIAGRKPEDQAMIELMRNLQREILERDVDTSGGNSEIALADFLKGAMTSNHWCFLPNFRNPSAILRSYEGNELDEYAKGNRQIHLYDFIVYANNCLDSFARHFKECMDSTSYLGPVLDDPRRYYYGTGGVLSTVGKRGEHTFDIISDNSDTMARVNEWFYTFDIPYELRGVESVASVSDLTGSIDAMLLIDKRTNTRVTPADVGFGISQILPVIVEGVAGNSRIICADQPEIHLHPRLQAEIADLLIETRDEKQWIVETHSELLARRIQTRIAAGEISPDEVSVLYVQPGPQGSTISVLEIDEEGDWLQEWPDGFFEERQHEMFNQLRFNEKRRLEGSV